MRSGSGSGILPKEQMSLPGAYGRRYGWGQIQCLEEPRRLIRRIELTGDPSNRWTVCRGTTVRQRAGDSDVVDEKQAPRTLSPGKKMIYAVATPLIPFLMLYRMFRNVSEKKRERATFLGCLPLLSCFMISYALGEAVGLLLGGGNSLSRVE